MNPDLKKIKKLYGENMMHLCRGLFPTILEEPGRLVELMTQGFKENHFLYEDIISNQKIDDFQLYINKLNDKEEEVEEVEKSVKELLNEAGYHFYECETEEDIQSFRKYYEKNEELCTFWTNRLNTCYVFFAVKKNVDEIKREDFNNPNRQDEYGTSVISIQFTKNSSNTLSIKNRYNHTVSNPDATFSNNLENIIPGLTKSFEREYNLNITQNAKKDLEIPGYVKANDKFYKYNYEIDNIYYCHDNIIIENFEEKQLEKDKFLVMDFFALDLVNKKMMVNEKSPIAKSDCFIDEFNDIDKINIYNREKNIKEVVITTKTNHEIIIGLDDKNRIISYHNPRVTEIKDNFLHRNKELRSLSLPNVTKVGNNFVESSRELTTIDMPKIKTVGNRFIPFSKLEEISFEHLEKIGDYFLGLNGTLTKINLPAVKEIGNVFVGFNLNIKEMNLPNVETIGECFMNEMSSLEKFSAPKLKTVGDYFLSDNKKIKELSLPSLEETGKDFLSKNRILEHVDLPKLKKVGNCFLSGNDALKEISLPSLEEAGMMFILMNRFIEKVNLPKLRKVETSFLHNNVTLKKLYLPELEEIESTFMVRNEVIEDVDLPKLKHAGMSFLCNNKALKNLNLLSLESMGSGFLETNEILESLCIPNVKSIRKSFLNQNKNLNYLDITNATYIDGFFLPNNEQLHEIHASNLNLIIKKDLEERFEIIGKESESKEEIIIIKEEPKEEKEIVIDEQIIQIEKCSKTLSSRINDFIKKGINLFSRKPETKERVGIKK